MARTHEQMVRDLFERWNGGSVELPREDAHPELEIVSRLSKLRGRPFKGHAEVESWIRDMHDSFDEWTLHAQEFEPVGPDRLLVVGRVRYRGRGSGAAMEMPAAWIFDFEDGRCIRLETFSQRVQEAREQARSAPARSTTR
jgi:ketosteroid isomerase-like protein